MREKNIAIFLNLEDGIIAKCKQLSIFIKERTLREVIEVIEVGTV